ncbi:MAG: hypothetical protein EXR92_03410 [Gemmatimonadetes bacterium]|nr:hypothetical protein [Gemmatimonadota bacterium]
MGGRRQVVTASGDAPPKWLIGAIAAVVVLGAIGYVGLTLRRPELPSFPPSPLEPRPANGQRVGPVLYTVDARDTAAWRFFSFSQGSIVVDPRPFDWDLAFRRFEIIVNGGEAFPGMGGVQEIDGASLDSLPLAPEDGYVGSQVISGDSLSASLGDWYDYSFLSHLLSPRPRTYLIRTADGRYAKLRFESYYCPLAQPGCVTFEYYYQGGGGRDFQSDGVLPEASLPP